MARIASTAPGLTSLRNSTKPMVNANTDPFKDPGGSERTDQHHPTKEQRDGLVRFCNIAEAILIVVTLLAIRIPAPTITARVKSIASTAISRIAVAKTPQATM